MTDKHASMPGMDHTKKAAQGPTPAKAKKVPKAKPSKASARHAKAGHKPALPKP